MHSEAMHSSVEAGQSDWRLHVGDGFVVVVSSPVLDVLDVLVVSVVVVGEEEVSPVLVRISPVSSLAAAVELPEVELPTSPVEAVVLAAAALAELVP